MQHFLDTIKNPNTRRAYRNDLARFEEWRAAQGVALAELRVRHFAAYRDHLAQALGMPSSANRGLAAVRAFVQWAALREEVPAEVAAAATVVPALKLEKRLPKLLTDAEFDALLALPDGSTPLGRRDRAMLLLLRYTGMRVGELVGLTVEALQFEGLDGALRPARWVAGPVAGGQAMVLGKGAKERIVLFERSTAYAILAYLEVRGLEEGPLLLNQNGGPLSERGVAYLLADYGAQIGRPDLHPHLLRHTFATWLLDETGDEDLVRMLIGHEDTKTVRIYTRLATSRRRDAYKRAAHQEELAPVAQPPVVAIRRE